MERLVEVALSPSGRLWLEEAEEGAGPAVPKGVVDAFGRGAGAGLLHLGAVELRAELPPGLSHLRVLGRLFMARLCAAADLEERRDAVEVPAPAEELGRLVLSTPPFKGSEHLSVEILGQLWKATELAFRDAIRDEPGPVQGYLHSLCPLWNVVGRVCFHLAERKRDPDRPFAFLATYAARLSERGTVQHQPLGKAVGRSADRLDREALLALLLPVQRAAAQSELVAELVRSRAIYQPQLWTPAQALAFLREVPLLEASGLVVRVPAWWNASRPPRPRVQVTLGERPRPRLDARTLLDFSVSVSVDGEPLGREELEAVLAAGEGLVLLKGRWVEVDRDLLGRVLDRWREAERLAADGVPFKEAMRLLAGLPGGPGDAEGDDEAAAWTEVHAGDWLREQLAGLRDPSRLAAVELGDELRADLRPYQEVGLRWLWLLSELGLGACLADDMGLGKTVQLIALLLALKRRGAPASLLVVPASLIANWTAELERFAPSLRAAVAHPSAGGDAGAAGEEEVDGVDLVITSYGMLRRLDWLGRRDWELVVLDEAQAIKNPGAKQSRAAKRLRGRVRIALTGTPVENRLTDLWSIFDFTSPGLLGSARELQDLARRLAESGEGFAPIRRLVRPYVLRRLKSDPRIAPDLPDKTEVRAFCGLTPTQAALYQQSVDALAEALADKDQGIERRGIVLAFLTRLKQICNHPSQWLGDERWEPGESGKLLRLEELCRPIAERQDKVLVFTQFRQMVAPLERCLAGIFGRPGASLHGRTPVRRRAEVVDAFQRDGGPPFLVLSLKVGGTGLNLTAASHVVHFDRWWNPAVESQATDRAFRIGQRRNVLVHKLVCRGTVEERIDGMIADKEALAEELLGTAGGEALLTEMGDEELLRTVALDIRAATAE